jgi:FMN phosphatase YigB (HAD superfamily)
MHFSGYPANPTNCKVCSFDVFDTLLYRRTGMPETVFEHMAGDWSRRFGLPAPKEFIRMRTVAESFAQQRFGRDTVSMEEIYDEVCSTCGEGQPSGEQLIAFELETEGAVLQPSERGREMVSRARKDGKPVIFLSDTYLPESFLLSVLSSFGLVAADDRLYASSARGASKASGALYNLVQKDLGIPPAAFLHFGNSAKVDVDVARKAGWQALRLDDVDWTKREQLLWYLGNTTATLSRNIHAAARNARIDVLQNTVDESEKVAASIGSGVAGPILVAYAQWLLEEARVRGLQELFFLSRDAQVTYEVCRILAAPPGRPAPKLTYVYGSRQVWAFHALRSLPESQRAEFFADSLAYAAENLGDCTALLDLADNAGIQSLIADITGGLVFAPSRQDRLNLYQSIAEHPVLGEVLAAKLDERADAYRSYLKQLSERPDSSCGIVDIGWSGMWTEIVGAMLREVGVSSVQGFQMGRFRKNSPSWNVPVRCFLFDETEACSALRMPKWLVPLLEAFCGADHGRVVRMERLHGVIRPIESPSKYGGLPENLFQTFRSGVTGFAREWRSLAGAKREAVGERNALVEICRQFWEYPTSAEASFIRGIEVGLAPNVDSDHSLVRPYRAADLVRLLSTTHLPGFEPHWWHRGCLATTSLPLAVAMATSRGLIDGVKTIVKRRRLDGSALGPKPLREKLKFLKWLFLTKND